MSHSAGAKLRSNMITHNTSTLLIFYHTCERPSDNLSPPGSHTAHEPMTLPSSWFLQDCWWAEVFHKHKDPNTWTVITKTADESRLGNQVTGQVLLQAISSSYHKQLDHNLVSSEGNPVCILQDCSATWNRAQEVEITSQVETVSAKHNPYLNKMLLTTPWILSHCTMHSTALNTRQDLKRIVHFSTCYNSGGTTMCVKIETFFFPLSETCNSHKDHTSSNQD